MSFESLFQPLEHLHLSRLIVLSERGSILYDKMFPVRVSPCSESDHDFFENIVQLVHHSLLVGEIQCTKLQFSTIDFIMFQHGSCAFLGISKYQRNALIVERLPFGILVCMAEKPVKLKNVFPEVDRFCKFLRG